MAFWLPDRYLKRISCLDLQKDIIGQGIKNIILDVDNTILTRDTSTVPEDVAKWLADARNAGIKFCLLSNDWHSNVTTLAKDLELPIVTKSLKPLPHGFLMAMKRIGASKNETLMVGDQLMTDVLGAHFVGLKVCLVEPLVEKDLKHTLILRKFERVILGDKKPEGQKWGKNGTG